MPWVAELFLFLLPFGAFALWRKLNPDTEPSRIFLILAAIGIVLAAAGAAWYGLNRRLDGDVPYEPAHLRNGEIVRDGG